MLNFAVSLLTFGLLVLAQENTLSHFTVQNWNDIHFGHPKLLTWTEGNGRPVSVQLDNDNGPYVFDFIPPEGGNTSFSWTPQYTMSAGPHKLVLTQGPVADTSATFFINGYTPNNTSTNTSTISFQTPTGPAGTGSSTSATGNVTATLTGSILTSVNPGGPISGASTTTVLPGSGSVISSTVLSTFFDTSCSCTQTSSFTPVSTLTTSPTDTAVESASSTGSGASAAPSLQTGIAARTSGFVGSSVALGLVGMVGFAWLML
ncbi:MAG: hypothetical protein M1820_001993 [Bogoriella megaspora]|nr:MAG: hypothetical protein M1820_001993 [Bogoriella megaspora]